MSNSTLQLLKAISFLNNDNTVADLEKIPLPELAAKLRYYYDKCIELSDRQAERIAAIGFGDASLVSSISASNSVMDLVPKLLVQEALVANDPLFAFATPTSEHSKVEIEAMGFGANEGVNLGKLHNKLLYFSMLAPFLEAGFLHVIPTSLLHKAPDVLPVYAPKNLYRERVPQKAVEFVFRSVVVNPLARTSNRMIVVDEPNHKRNRQICVSFRGDDTVTHGSFYFFRQVEYLGENPDGSLKIAYPPWNDDPLDEAQYKIWEEQVINQTVGARLESIGDEMRLAQTLGAPYMTESAFEAELLARSGGIVEEDASTLAVNFLEANSGLLNLTDPNLIFRIRTEKAELFERFRLSLKDISLQLRGVEEKEFAARAKQLFEREVQPQIAEINGGIGKIVESAGKGLLQTGGGLLLALQTGPSIAVAALLGFAANGIVGEAIPAIGDYLRSRKRPEFIWNKLRP
jgi:hypothetical protein